MEIIANDQGNRITPSWVAFTDEERLIGDSAKNQAPQNPSNTVFDAKRLIGRNFEDPDVQRDAKHFPFKLVNKGGKVMIEVNHRGDVKDFVSAGTLPALSLGATTLIDVASDPGRDLGNGPHQDEGDCGSLPWPQGYSRSCHRPSM